MWILKEVINNFRIADFCGFFGVCKIPGA